MSIAAGTVGPEEPRRAPTVPERQRVGVALGVGVLGGRELEHGVIAGGRRERVAGRLVPRAEWDVPIACDLVGHAIEPLRGLPLPPRSVLVGHRSFTSAAPALPDRAA